jgi:hypothetical protein
MDFKKGIDTVPFLFSAVYRYAFFRSADCSRKCWTGHASAIGVIINQAIYKLNFLKLNVQ